MQKQQFHAVNSSAERSARLLRKQGLFFEKNNENLEFLLIMHQIGILLSAKITF